MNTPSNTKKTAMSQKQSFRHNEPGVGLLTAFSSQRSNEYRTGWHSYKQRPGSSQDLSRDCSPASSKHRSRRGKRGSRNGNSTPSVRDSEEKRTSSEFGSLTISQVRKGGESEGKVSRS